MLKLAVPTEDPFSPTDREWITGKHVCSIQHPVAEEGYLG